MGTESRCEPGAARAEVRAPALLTTPGQELREATGTWHQDQDNVHQPGPPRNSPLSSWSSPSAAEPRWGGRSTAEQMAMGYQHGICQPCSQVCSPHGVLGDLGTGCSEGKGSRSHPRQGQHPQIGSMDLTQPRDTVPPSPPKPLPIWEVTDPFTANRGSASLALGKGGRRKGAVCAASSEISASPQGEAASLPSSWLRHCRCPREPPRRNEPMAATERRQMQPGHCSRHLQRSGLSPSLWCLLVFSLTSCRGCAEASEHSSPTHLAHEPCQELKGNGPSATQPRTGDRAKVLEINP